MSRWFLVMPINNACRDFVIITIAHLFDSLPRQRDDLRKEIAEIVRSTEFYTVGDYEQFSRVFHDPSYISRIDEYGSITTGDAREIMIEYIDRMINDASMEIGEKPKNLGWDYKKILRSVKNRADHNFPLIGRPVGQRAWDWHSEGVAQNDYTFKNRPYIISNRGPCLITITKTEEVIRNGKKEPIVKTVFHKEGDLNDAIAAMDAAGFPENFYFDQREAVARNMHAMNAMMVDMHRTTSNMMNNMFANPTTHWNDNGYRYVMTPRYPDRGVGQNIPNGPSTRLSDAAGHKHSFTEPRDQNRYR